MLTLMDVRRFVDNSAYYARGRVYADEGRVRYLLCERRADGTKLVTAQVVGLGERYEASARYDDASLHECRCSCPAFARTQTMCKHVAAMLIAHAEEENGNAARAGAEMRASEQARLDAEKRDQEQKETQHRFLEGLLGELRARREDGVRLRHEAAGDVRLYPTVICADARVHIELKIGRTRTYVVRSLQAFGQCAADRAMETYGKELTFSHTEEELYPQDVELYHAVTDLARRLQPKGARMTLEGADLDRVMRLLVGREAEMRLDDLPPQPARVIEGGGSVEGQLEPQGEGHLLTVTAQRAVHGARGIYFFLPEAGEIRCAWGRDYAPLAPLMQIAQRFPQGLQLDAQQLQETAARLLVPAGMALTMKKGGEILRELTPMTMKPRFLIDMDGRERLTCEVQYDYGVLSLLPGEDNPHIRRDTPGEEEAMLCARRVFPVEQTPGRYAFEGKEDAVFDLLTQSLPEMKKDGEVLVAERLKKLNVHQRRAVTFGVTKGESGLLVKADLGGLTQPDLEAAYAAYRQKKRYIVLEDGAFLSGEALRQAAETAEIAKGLNLSAEELAAGANVSLNRALYLDAALKEREEMELAAPGELEDFIRRLGEAKNVQAQQPATLRATLRPYQLTGYNWLCQLCEAGFGGILADDMGLGKTLQALSLLLAEKEKGKAVRALVVCPASLQLNWLSEAKKFTPDLRCEALLGSAQQRREAILREDAPDVLIVSYDQLRRDAQAYHGRTYTHVLLDEAQNIKNAASQAAKAVKSIHAEHRFAMTGTPIENRLSELWSIFDFIMPGYLLPYKKFRERFEAPIVQDNDEQARRNLRLLVSPFILRRMKRDVLTDLPEKVESVMRSEMTPEQEKIYRAHAAKLLGELDQGAAGAQQRIRILAGITRLRQICCEPSLCLEGYMGGSGKLEQCVELIRNAVQADHEILLFSQFTSMLDILKERLDGEGMTTFMLKGDTDKEERMKLVERFNAGEADVFLISLKAGGTGLNLTGADMVIHYDPWWNTAAQNQATDRAYRIGQTQSVQVYKLIAADTIEERIVRLQEEKMELSDAVLTDSEGMGALDEETMKKLLF